MKRSMSQDQTIRIQEGMKGTPPENSWILSFRAQATLSQHPLKKIYSATAMSQDHFHLDQEATATSQDHSELNQEAKVMSQDQLETIIQAARIMMIIKTMVMYTMILNIAQQNHFQPGPNIAQQHHFQPPPPLD